MTMRDKKSIRAMLKFSFYYIYTVVPHRRRDIERPACPSHVKCTNSI